MENSTRKVARNTDVLRRNIRGETYAKIAREMDASYPRIVDIGRKERERVLGAWHAGQKTLEDLAHEYGLTVSEVDEILVRETDRAEALKTQRQHEEQAHSAEQEEYFSHIYRGDLEDHWLDISQCPSTLLCALLFDGVSVIIGVRISPKAPWLSNEEPVKPLYWMRIPSPPKEWKKC